MHYKHMTKIIASFNSWYIACTMWKPPLENDPSDILSQIKLMFGDILMTLFYHHSDMSGNILRIKYDHINFKRHAE